MNDATSLDNLHDIVLPPSVSWWPPSPAWFLLAALLLGLLVWQSYRFIQHRRANAYRREALLLLARCETAAAIAELLRRTALVAMPRTEIASQTGAEWVECLAAYINEPVPDPVRRELTEGVYASHKTSANVDALRSFAAHWIACHQPTESARER